MQKEPITRKSLSQEVAALLQQKIQNGIFAEGDKLPTEPELMEQFAVGRSTIREAVKYLAQSGYVNVQQGLGTFVKSASGNTPVDTTIENGNFTDIYEVRQILELKIIEKASTKRTTKHLKKMKEELAKRKVFAEKGDLNGCIESDIAFHSTIAESSGNRILAALYKTLSMHVTKHFFDVYKDTTSFQVSQELHEILLQNISEKDTASAMETAQKIIGN